MNHNSYSESVDRDRKLVWELYDAQPDHPQIPVLARSVLAQNPEYTGMIVALALHLQEVGEIEEARELLQELVGRRDHQYVNAVKELRDLEFAAKNYPEALSLAEIVLREQPDARWLEHMEYGSALIFTGDIERGWRVIDEAVESVAATDPEEHALALGQRAIRLLLSGASPERFLPAAEAAVEADPTEMGLSLALGYAYLYNYRPEAAEELLRRVLREDPFDKFAKAGLGIARSILDQIESGAASIDDYRTLGAGELVWRMMRDHLFGTSVEKALAALDAVLPEALLAVLGDPLSEDLAAQAGGNEKLLAWHDGQQAGTGELWGSGSRFRLMSSVEIADMDSAIEQHPENWQQWTGDDDFYTQVLTDDAGAYFNEGSRGQLFLRTPGVADRVIASSLSDWLWDRVVAFGGEDPRPPVWANEQE